MAEQHKSCEFTRRQFLRASVTNTAAFSIGLGAGAFLLADSPTTSPDSPPLKIALNGKSDYIIALSPNPSAAEQLAAAELREYLNQISQAEIPIQQLATVPARAIVPRVHRQTSRPVHIQASQDAYQIIAHVDGQLILEGNSDRALLYAAYRFLHELGCRFLSPKFDHYRGSAETIPRRSNLTFPIKTIQAKPAFAYRKLYVEEGHSHNAQNLKQLIEWMPKAGFNVLVIPIDYQGRGHVKWDNWREALIGELQQRGIVIEVGGHGYQNFINGDMPAHETTGKTLFDVHPEWFAQDETGQRRREHNWVFNTANPQAVQFLVNNLVDYVQARSEIQILDFWPPDGERWDQSDEGKRQGTPTDRMVMLTNQVRNELVRIRPDIQLECIAYNHYTQPPRAQKLQSDVLVDFCPIQQSFEVPLNDPSNARNAEYVHDLSAWRKDFDGDISLYSYYRKYAWQSLPVALPHYLQKDLQFFQSLPLQGISIYSEPGDWFTYEANYYVLAKLAWDPRCDVNALLAGFTQARYGAASETAVEAMSVLEKVVRNFGSIPGTSLKQPEALKQAADQIRKTEKALTLSAEDSALKDDAVRFNLSRLILDCQYAQRDIAIQTMRAEQASEERLIEAVHELHEFLAAHADEGIFLMQDPRLSEHSLLNHYGLKTERK